MTIIPKIVPLNEARKYVSCYGESVLRRLVESGEVHGGRLRESDSGHRKYWIDLYDLIRYTYGTSVKREQDEIEHRVEIAMKAMYR